MAHARMIPWYRRRVLSQLPPAVLGGLWAVISIYGVAHLVPALHVSIFKEESEMFGWNASLAAAGGALHSLEELRPDWLCIFGWLPNPLLWAGWTFLAMSQRDSLRLSGLVAGAAGLIAFVGATLWVFWGGPSDLRLGYYLWLASMALLGLFGFLTAAIARSPSSLLADARQ